LLLLPPILSGLPGIRALLAPLGGDGGAVRPGRSARPPDNRTARGLSMHRRERRNRRLEIGGEIGAHLSADPGAPEVRQLVTGSGEPRPAACGDRHRGIRVAGQGPIVDSSPGRPGRDRHTDTGDRTPGPRQWSTRGRNQEDSTNPRRGRTGRQSTLLRTSSSSGC